MTSSHLPYKIEHSIRQRRSIIDASARSGFRDSAAYNWQPSRAGRSLFLKLPFKSFLDVPDSKCADCRSHEPGGSSCEYAVESAVVPWYFVNALCLTKDKGVNN